MTGLKAFVQ